MRKPAIAGLHTHHDVLAATAAFFARRLFLGSFPCRLAGRFLLGRFFLRCLFLGRGLLCRLLLGGFLLGRSFFLRWRFLGRSWAASATSGWCRRGFPHRLRGGARTIFHHSGFFFLFFFLLKILFQRFAVGAAVGVLVGFIIAAPEGPIIEAHSSSCEFDGHRAWSAGARKIRQLSLANLH